MRVLLFGGSGQVGTALRRLAADGVTLSAPGHAALDLAQPAAIAAAIATSGADLVVNAAAYTAVDKAESEPELARRINGDAPGAMAVECARRGIPLVHISTDYVFDGTRRGALTEDDPVGPLGVYGVSKLAGEQAVRRAGGAHAILRTSWIFSDHGTNFVKTMLRLAAERPELRVVDDQTGGPTAAEAVARAALAVGQALAGGDGAAGTFHFSGAPPTTWFAFAGEILERWRALTGRPVPRLSPIPTSAYPTPARRPANSVLDCGLIQRTFGIAQPDWRADLDETLRRLAAKGS